MGKLYLIPSYIATQNLNYQLPTGIEETIKDMDIFIVENIRTARRFIKLIVKDKNIDHIRFYELNKHTDIYLIGTYLDDIESRDIGLISEAGVPCIADPGAKIVDMAHERNVEVVPITGPSSILLALMGSGLNGQEFTFHGYLPVHKTERIQKIKTLEKTANQKGQSQIFMETPYRNNQLLHDLLTNCQSNTKLCIACEIYGNDGFIKTKTMNEWKKSTPDLHKKTVVFVLGI